MKLEELLKLELEDEDLDRLDYICQTVPVEARLEQLAEEASELSQAALKLARIYRGENPTSETENKARVNLRDEYTDVVTAALALYLPADVWYMQGKIQRWVSRLEKKNAESV